MNTKLNNEKEYLVLENLKLVYYLVDKFGITKNSSEYEEFISIGTLGLVKAAITFNASKRIAFSTYATKCINNEFFMYCRKNNKYARNISIDEPITANTNSDEFVLSNIIEDPNSNFIEKILAKEDFIELISIVLNCLKEKDRIIMLYKIGNLSQKDIAKKIGVSQSNISRKESILALKVREIANQQIPYKKVFSVKLVENTYKISFLLENISNLNKISTTLSQILKSTKIPANFKINYNKKRIVINVPTYLKSFCLIAKIIQELDKYF